jgi:hypothetical protein
MMMVRVMMFNNHNSLIGISKGAVSISSAAAEFTATKIESDCKVTSKLMIIMIMMMMMKMITNMMKMIMMMIGMKMIMMKMKMIINMIMIETMSLILLITIMMMLMTVMLIIYLIYLIITINHNHYLSIYLQACPMLMWLSSERARWLVYCLFISRHKVRKHRVW